jgi:hypothetical protein
LVPSVALQPLPPLPLLLLLLLLSSSQHYLMLTC